MARTRRYYVNLVLSLVTGVLTLLTALVPEWMELFGFDPDGGSGVAEIAVVAGFAIAALATGVRARREYRALA